MEHTKDCPKLVYNSEGQLIRNAKERPEGHMIATKGQNRKKTENKSRLKEKDSPEILSFHLDRGCLDFQEFRLDQATNEK